MLYNTTDYNNYTIMQLGSLYLGIVEINLAYMSLTLQQWISVLFM